MAEAAAVDVAMRKFAEAHAGLEIAPATGLTLWNGKTPEYGWCVEARVDHFR